jgi:glycosyltransferase involved in cell wall biosynthesis
LSVIIPARDEEGCIASTVEHLHLELDLRGVPHEIIVVDDGSTDRTWQILQEEAARLNAAPLSPSSPSTLNPQHSTDDSSPPSDPLHAPCPKLHASPTRHRGFAACMAGEILLSGGLQKVCFLILPAPSASS